MSTFYFACVEPDSVLRSNSKTRVKLAYFMAVSLAKRWLVAQQAPVNLLKQYRGISPVLAQVLYNRGFIDPDHASKFIYTKEASHNPFELKDMAKLVGRVRQAIRNREHVVIYGDFDADGVTSTTLMVQVLRALGAHVSPYIPHRIDEGYGLNTPALQSMAQKGVKLVITVDCGIRSVQEVEDGKAAGLDIIITDHHSLGPELPNAYAVVNPKREGYPEDMLAGVGVAFKVAEALLMAQSQQNGRRNSIELSSLVDLVAIGTVADLMPLNRLENRALVRRGLQVLNASPRPGIQALYEVAGLKQGLVNAGSIGFGIGPRINAAGRLSDAMIAYRLLASQTVEEAMQYAHQLQELNTKRQEITRAAQDKIRETLDHQAGASLIMASDPSFEPGIVGLVAGKLVEEYYLPAVVMEEGEEESRASCRSIPQFDITAALDQCADLLVRHGGHALAAGFTVRNENIPALRQRLMSLADSALKDQQLCPTLDIDVKVDVHQLSENLVDELSLLEPTGHANKSPVFMAGRARILECRTVGKDERHLKLKIARAGQPPLDAIGFGLGDWSRKLDEFVDLAFQIEMNEWNGKQTLQLRLEDVRHPQAD